LVLATANAHKSEELAAILRNLGFCRLDIRTLRDYPTLALGEETGGTFRQNARGKALAVSLATGEWALADDSGLVVDALGGGPGVHSARYAGENATDEERVRKLLHALRDVEGDGRRARFVCAVALARDGSVVAEAEGECEGVIVAVPRGTGGFGYDPVFFVPELGVTLAEVGADEKNRISHRARALENLRTSLMTALGLSCALP
jgi:XTP/dITP diphosphohydrolase